MNKETKQDKLVLECIRHGMYACEENGTPIKCIQVGSGTARLLKQSVPANMYEIKGAISQIDKFAGVEIKESHLMPEYGYAYIGLYDEVLHAGVIKNEN